MSKSDQKRIGRQAEANSKQDQANAGTAFAGVGSGINTFQQGIGNYQNWLNQTYGPGGTFLTNSNVLANDVSQGSQASLVEDLARNAQRTGDNTANFAPTEAEAARTATRDLTSFKAKQQDEALNRLNSGQQFAVGEEGRVPSLWESAYGASLGGSDNSLNTAQRAENQPAWWQTALDYAAKGGQAYQACWIAEALWSPSDIRTHVLRAWLNGPFMQRKGGRAVMWLYRLLGRQVAGLASHSAAVRALLLPIFRKALNKALSEIG